MRGIGHDGRSSEKRAVGVGHDVQGGFETSLDGGQKSKSCVPIFGLPDEGPGDKANESRRFTVVRRLGRLDSGRDVVAFRNGHKSLCYSLVEERYWTEGPLVLARGKDEEQRRIVKKWHGHAL